MIYPPLPYLVIVSHLRAAFFWKRHFNKIEYSNHTKISFFLNFKFPLLRCCLWMWIPFLPCDPLVLTIHAGNISKLKCNRKSISIDLRQDAGFSLSPLWSTEHSLHCWYCRVKHTLDPMQCLNPLSSFVIQYIYKKYLLLTLVLSGQAYYTIPPSPSLLSSYVIQIMCFLIYSLWVWWAAITFNLHETLEIVLSQLPVPFNWQSKKRAADENSNSLCTLLHNIWNCFGFWVFGKQTQIHPPLQPMCNF